VGTWAPGVLASIIMGGTAVYAWPTLMKRPAPALAASGEMMEETAEAVETGVRAG
jgi:hypothetical protein